MSRSRSRFAVGWAAALCASAGSGCAVLSTQALLPALAKPALVDEAHTPTGGGPLEAATNVAMPDWAVLFSEGDFRRVRDWSPLANSARAARGGGTWMAHRWEWDVPRERRAAWEVAVRDISHRDRGGRWDDVVAAGRRLPEPARTRFAIWVARHSPETSRDIVSLDVVVSPSRTSLRTVFQVINSVRPESNTPLPANTRLAAAVAWCDQLRGARPSDVSQPSPSGPTNADLELALAPAGLLLADDTTPVEVREEVMLALARDIPPDRLPGWVEWLRSDSGEQAAPDDLRRNRTAFEAALTYMVFRAEADRFVTASESADIAETPPWSETLVSVPVPANVAAREARAATLALAGDSRVLDDLTGGLRAGDWSSREHAALCLGLFPGSAGRSELEKGRTGADEALAELALRGLAVRDDFDAREWRAAAPRVREALASILKAHPKSEFAEVLSDLLADARPTIQAKAVESLTHWPDDIAWGPLLDGLAKGTFATRQALHADLERRTGRAVPFPVAGDVRSRADRAAELARELPASQPGRLTERSGGFIAEGVEARRTELRGALAQQASTGMTNGPESGVVDSLTERDLPILEDLLAAASDVERETLWNVWLPKAGGAYAALSELNDTDVVARRMAADKLVTAARGRTLPGPILQRLARTMSTEQDPLVFRSVLRAVADDSTEDARQVAKTALHSPWDDIRLAGIEYVARHRLAEAAAWLLPILDSPNAAPRRAAVIAAGLCGNPLVLDGTRDAQGEVVYGGLRPLLGTASSELRRDVVLAMARLGDATGIEELHRAAVDTDPMARAWAVRAMRESGQSRFVTELTRLLWVERDTRVRQEGLATLAALVPPDQHPRWPATATLDDRIDAWVAWDRSRTQASP